jgi:hypothetical protein
MEKVERRRLGRRTQRLRWRVARERTRVGVILIRARARARARDEDLGDDYDR